jgi:hypothetical protein
MLRWMLHMLFGVDAGCGIDPNGCHPKGPGIDPIGG